MKALLKKLKTSATHLNALNQFCIDNSLAYKAMHKKMTHLTSYHDMAELLPKPIGDVIRLIAQEPRYRAEARRYTKTLNSCR